MARALVLTTRHVNLLAVPDQFGWVHVNRDSLRSSRVLIRHELSHSVDEFGFKEEESLLVGADADLVRHGYVAVLLTASTAINFFVQTKVSDLLLLLWYRVLINDCKVVLLQNAQLSFAQQHVVVDSWQVPDLSDLFGRPESFRLIVNHFLITNFLRHTHTI